MRVTNPDSPVSPCTNVCRMHALTGFCEGCARTIDEIIEWSRASAGRQHEILMALPKRRSALQAFGIAIQDARGVGKT